MYFNEKGNINTEKCAELAIQAAKDKNIKHIVIASNILDTKINEIICKPRNF